MEQLRDTLLSNLKPGSLISDEVALTKRLSTRFHQLDGIERTMKEKFSPVQELEKKIEELRDLLNYPDYDEPDPVVFHHWFLHKGLDKLYDVLHTMSKVSFRKTRLKFLLNKSDTSDLERKLSLLEKDIEPSLEEIYLLDQKQQHVEAAKEKATHHAKLAGDGVATVQSDSHPLRMELNPTDFAALKHGPSSIGSASYVNFFLDSLIKPIEHCRKRVGPVAEHPFGTKTTKRFITCNQRFLELQKKFTGNSNKVANSSLTISKFVLDWNKFLVAWAQEWSNNLKKLYSTLSARDIEQDSRPDFQQFDSNLVQASGLLGMLETDPLKLVTDFARATQLTLRMQKKKILSDESKVKAFDTAERDTVSLLEVFEGPRARYAYSEIAYRELRRK